MSRIIDDYILKLRAQIKLPYNERGNVLNEIRDHLQTEARALRNQDRTLSQDEAELRATTAFGAPEEIGIAYSPSGTVVRNSAGDVLLRVATLTGRAAGRGAKGVLKWTGITALVLVGVGLVFLLATLVFAGEVVETFQDDIRESVPRPIYDYDGAWGMTDPQANTHSDSFAVGSRVKEFRIGFETSPTSGCVAIQMISPSGSIIEVNGNGCSPTDKMLTFTEHGTWQVRYTFAAYTGSVDVDAYAFETAPARS